MYALYSNIGLGTMHWWPPCAGLEVTRNQGQVLFGGHQGSGSGHIWRSPGIRVRSYLEVTRDQRSGPVWRSPGIRVRSYLEVIRVRSCLEVTRDQGQVMFGGHQGQVMFGGHQGSGHVQKLSGSGHVWRSPDIRVRLCSSLFGGHQGSFFKLHEQFCILTNINI